MTGKTRSLYEISADLEAIETLLEELGGDVTDADVEKQIDEYLENLEIERDQKLDNYAALIREIDSRSKTRAVEASRLSLLAARGERSAAKLQSRLKQYFERHGMNGKLETDRFSFKLANNGGKLPIEINENLDAAELPEHLRRVKFEVDKDAVRTALEAGEDLDFARLLPRGRHLRIS